MSTETDLASCDAGHYPCCAHCGCRPEHRTGHEHPCYLGDTTRKPEDVYDDGPQAPTGATNPPDVGAGTTGAQNGAQGGTERDRFVQAIHAKDCIFWNAWDAPDCTRIDEHYDTADALIAEGFGDVTALAAKVAAVDAHLAEVDARLSGERLTSPTRIRAAMEKS